MATFEELTAQRRAEKEKKPSFEELTAQRRAGQQPQSQPQVSKLPTQAELDEFEAFGGSNMMGEENAWDSDPMGTAPGAGFDSNILAGDVREFLDFPGWGGADELEAGIKSIPALVPGGESPGEAFTRNMEDIKSKKEQFRKDYPMDAKAAHDTGVLADVYINAIANPLGSLEKLGSKYLPKATKYLSKALRTGGDKPLANFLRNTAQSSALGAVQGGTTGFLSADSGDRASEAVRGTGLGSLFGLGGGFLSEGLRAFGKRRIAKDLAEKGTKNFTPIGAAEDASDTVRGVYNQGLQRVSPKYRGQLKDAIVKNEERAKGLEKSIKAQDDIVEADAKVKLKEKSDKRAEELLALEEREKAAVKEATGSAKGRRKVLKKALENTKEKAAFGTSREIEGNKRTAEKILNKTDEDTRKQVIKDSLPASVSAEDAEKIASMQPQQAMKEVNKKWAPASEGGVAFKSVRSKTEGFDIPLTHIADNVKKEVESVGGGKHFQGIIEDIQSTVFKKMKDGKLTADEMLEARNSLGMMSNAIKGTEGDANIRRAAINRAKEVLDDIILEQLPTKAAKESFKKDLERYRQRMIYKKAATGARRGEFTAEDYDRALGSKQSEKYLTGEADNQAFNEGNLRIKEKVAENAAGEQGAIAERGRENIKSIEGRGENIDKAVEGRLDKAKKAAAAEREAKALSVQENYEVAESRIREQADKLKAKEGTQEYDDLQNLKKLIESIKPKKGSIPKGLGTVSSLLTGGGGALLAHNPLLTALPVAIISAMSSKRGQRLVAGQWKIQNALRKHLSTNEGLTGKALDKAVESVMRALGRLNEMNLATED